MRETGSGRNGERSQMPKMALECQCLCHKGGVVLHVVACCENYVAVPVVPKSAPDSDQKEG